YGIPDVLGREMERYVGRRVAVVGSGHSAMNALLDLADLQARAPRTTITWAIRRAAPGQMFGGGADDALPERGALGSRARTLIESGHVELVAGFSVGRVEQRADGVILADGNRAIGPFDEVICASGFRPDLAPTRELRLRL